MEAEIVKKFDFFHIIVKCDHEICDIDNDKILLLSLQKYNLGWGKTIVFNDPLELFPKKNSDVELTLIKATIGKSIFKVKYNFLRDEELDSEEKILNYVKAIINKITHYSYYTPPNVKKNRVDIEIESIDKVVEIEKGIFEYEVY